MQVSVVIPTLNEAGRIGELIRSTRLVGPCEIVVVDGGSNDETYDRAAEADLRLTAPQGRAAQQNAGAAACRGDVLLFLHADCRLEAGGFDVLRSALADRNCVGGCFRQVIDAPGIAYRVLERGNSWRARTCKWAYGDQGLFVRREVFHRVGGFPDLKLMEDLFFMKRLAREGRIVVLDAPIYTSARRWQQHGIVRQTLRNWTLTTLAHCGVSPDRLARFYPHAR